MVISYKKQKKNKNKCCLVVCNCSTCFGFQHLHREDPPPNSRWIFKTKELVLQLVYHAAHRTELKPVYELILNNVQVYRHAEATLNKWNKWQSSGYFSTNFQPLKSIFFFTFFFLISLVGSHFAEIISCFPNLQLKTPSSVRGYLFVKSNRL